MIGGVRRMSNTKNRESKAYKNKMAYTRNYCKENCIKYYVSVNKLTEQDLVEYLGDMKNRATYIKRLIREDMERRGL